MGIEDPNLEELDVSNFAIRSARAASLAPYTKPLAVDHCITSFSTCFA
jgi:hypothetical protein